MRTGGAGRSKSIEVAPSHAAAHWGPDSSMGALGRSIWRGVLPSGMVNCAAAAAPSRANANPVLANIAGSIEVDDRPGRSGRRVGGEPANCLGDFGGVGHPAERNVGDDRRAAAALEVLLGHFRNGEARRHGEGEDIIRSITAGDGLGHADQRRLGRGIMPVAGAVAAKGGTAGDVDDPTAALPTKMLDGMTAEIRRRLQVYLERAAPGGMPFLVGRVVGDALVDAGIIDQHVDPSAQLYKGRFPDFPGSRRISK